MNVRMTYLRAIFAAFLVATLFAVPVLAQSSEGEDLMTNDWQWVSFTIPVEQFDVEMTES